MAVTRRRFALSATAFLSSLAGCSEFRIGESGSEDSLREIQLELANFTDSRHTFHFALEASDGLGQWHEFSVEPGGDGFVHRRVVVEPESDRDWSRVHAIAGDHRSSNEIIEERGGSTCLQLEYRLEEDQLTGRLVAEEPLC